MSPMTDPKPRRLRRVLLRSLTVLILLAAGLWAGNSSVLHGGGDGHPLVLAHRGLAQTFPLDGVQGDTCTAGRIDPPQHDHVENTLPSMRAAFAAGASMLEFDVQLTADGALAVFHDACMR